MNQHKSIAQRIAQGVLLRWLAELSRLHGGPINLYATFTCERGLKMVVSKAVDSAIEDALDELAKVYPEHTENEDIAEQS